MGNSGIAYLKKGGIGIDKFATKDLIHKLIYHLIFYSEIFLP